MLGRQIASCIYALRTTNADGNAEVIAERKLNSPEATEGYHDHVGMNMNASWLHKFYRRH